MRIMNSINFLPLLLFILSNIGIILNRTNIILVLICIEMMLLSISLNFLIITFFQDLFYGQLYSIYVITIAAVESAIGLSIMISFYKLISL